MYSLYGKMINNTYTNMQSNTPHTEREFKGTFLQSICLIFKFAEHYLFCENYTNFFCQLAVEQVLGNKLEDLLQGP